MTIENDNMMEVNVDYLWALEVLALDSMGVEGETSRDYSTRYSDAVGIAESANLVTSRNRYKMNGEKVKYTQDIVEGVQ